MPIGNLLSRILSQVGNTEIDGENNNPEIVKYFTEIGFDVKDDETAWCSAFLNWCCMKEDLPRSHNLSARSWLNGVGTKIDAPQFGDVVVFYRNERDGWEGHVGIFCNKIGGNIYVLGGNQNDQVGFKVYPEERVLGFRRLI